MRSLVLDAEAVDALLGTRHGRDRYVRQAISSAVRRGHQVLIPAVVLAELYRGRGRSRALDALLSRLLPNDVGLRDTDRWFAKLVGDLLTEAGLGSAYLADAHVVAAAVEGGGGVVLTGDPDDLARIASPYRVAVDALPGAAKRSRQ